MTKQKKAKSRAKTAYIDGDIERFEARLHKNAKTREPRVPAMISTKGKRTKFTGMTTKGAVVTLKTTAGKKIGKKR